MSGSAVRRRRGRTPPKTQVGRRLREARIAAGLTLLELARRSGWSQPYLSQIENGRRRPEAPVLVDLAPHVGLDAVDLLHPAYLDQLPAARRTKIPKDGGDVALRADYESARRLQERQFTYTVGKLRLEGVAHPDGSAVLTRTFLDCRPRPGRTVSEIRLSEHVFGRGGEEDDAARFSLLRVPRGLDHRVEHSSSGEWTHHVIQFPDGWPRAATPAGDRLSFSFTRRFAKAFAFDPAAYVKDFRVDDLRQPFVGGMDLHVAYLIREIEIEWKLPRGQEADDWAAHVWWGVPPGEDVDPRGCCSSIHLDRAPRRGRLVVKNPLAGYSIGFDWVPRPHREDLNARKESKR